MKQQQNKNLAVAVIFGLVSVPWTYLFGIFNLVLWPSFIASASFFASGAKARGFLRSYLNNFLGIAYAAITILITDSLFGSDLLWLSIFVGILMFVASMHYLVRQLSFMPATFFGYAVMFSVNAFGGTVFVSGLLGQFLAAALSMLIGALIGLSVDSLGSMIAGGEIRSKAI